MTLKNIIITKSAQNNIIDFNFKLNDKVISRLEKYNKLNLFINSEDKTDIKRLNLFSQIISKKILLYEPTEYDGWLLLLDYMNQLNIINDYSLYNKKNIFIDSELCGMIELSKYLSESDDNYYINEIMLNLLDDKKIKYLISMYKIKSVKADGSDGSDGSNGANKSNSNSIKYNIIVSKSIDKLDSYSKILTSDNVGGEILLILNILDIGTTLMDKLNQSLNFFDQIEFISPSVLKLSGDFVIIFRNLPKTKTTKTTGNLMIKLDNFFDYHLYKINKVLNSIKYLIDITNKDLQNKLISVYETKLNSLAINLFNKYNIPVNTKIRSYYDNKLLTINNKLYSSLNVISYQFINYESLDIKIKLNNAFETLSALSNTNNLVYTNLHNIAMNLNKIKRAIDTRYFKKWQYVTYQLDNYKSLGEYVSKKYDLLNDKKQKVSNAFLKIYEIMMTYELISQDDINLKSFHFCEAPGMFIIGLNHYLQTKTNIRNWEWYGNSLTLDANKTALSDMHGLIKANKNKWLIGPESSGDIRSLTNINYFKSILGEVDFITSDCGICLDSSLLNKYEEMIAETDFAQFINMINLLKVGGTGITKSFIPLELPSNVCIIYMMTQLFEEVYLSKPITSRPQNSEVYLVGKKFLGIKSDLLNDLKSLLDKSINPKFNPFNQWIESIPQSFLSQLEDYILDITRQQISYLLNIFHFVDNTHEIDKIKIISNNKLKESTNIYWCKKFNLVSNKKNKLI
jgi:23S rRNA U2552 (ribose-2'-O)-methylase RlmE/FtsJ